MSGFLSRLKSAFGYNAPIARQVAKERLSIMLVHQRSTSLLSDIDMEAFQSEVQAVVRKYMKLSHDKIPQISGTIFIYIYLHF